MSSEFFDKPCIIYKAHSQGAVKHEMTFKEFMFLEAKARNIITNSYNEKTYKSFRVSLYNYAINKQRFLSKHFGYKISLRFKTNDKVKSC
jgi:hypothetical protein